LLSVFFGATCHADQAVMMFLFGLASSGVNDPNSASPLDRSIEC